MENIKGELCPLCGNDYDKCGNNHIFNKMCVNCSHVEYSSENKCYFCNNIENMEEAKNKIIEAAKGVANGYSFTVDIKPLPIKKPQVKCPKWELNKEVENNLKNLFV